MEKDILSFLPPVTQCYPSVLSRFLFESKMVLSLLSGIEAALLKIQSVSLLCDLDFYHALLGPIFSISWPFAALSSLPGKDALLRLRFLLFIGFLLRFLGHHSLTLPHLFLPHPTIQCGLFYGLYFQLWMHNSSNLPHLLYSQRTLHVHSIWISRRVAWKMLSDIYVSDDFSFSNRCCSPYWLMTWLKEHRLVETLLLYSLIGYN